MIQRRSRRGAVLALLALAAAPQAGGWAQGAPAQGAATFTVDDLLDVQNVGIEDVSRDGRWVAATSGSLRDRIGIDNHRFADPTYLAPRAAEVLVIDTRTGATEKLFPARRQVESLRWSPDGSRLALLARTGDAYEPLIWERASRRLRPVALPRGRTVAENSELQWSADGRELLLSLRDEAWQREAREGFAAVTRGPIVVLSSEDPFLSWEALRRLPLRRSLVAYSLDGGSVRELLPETQLRSYSISPDGSFLTYLRDVTEKTDYDVISGSDNQVMVLPVAGGAPRMVIPSTNGRGLVWSKDGRRYAFAREGALFTGTVDDAEPRRLTAEPDSSREAASGETEREESFSAVRLSPSGDRLVASSRKGLWLIDTATGSKELFLPTPEEEKESPRYSAVEWSPDGRSLYLSYASRTEWQRGLVRYDLATKRLEPLIQDARIYSDFTLSDDGSTWVFSGAEGNRPADLFAADADFGNVRRLTDANPGLREKRLGRTELVSYLDVDGNKLYGVLYYPVDYVPGTKYPTVFNVYEEFFDDRFNGTLNVLTAQGYAVMQPSVTLETGYPAEAWVKGVTAAANKLVEMGVTDPERMGVQGTSYGGYAVNLLITQTNRFEAAVNISGKVNMISFYTDSPRLGVRNIHAPEKSQDRIGATLWEQPHKYLQSSAIMYADRIRTPLLLLTGEQDHNVPARQAMEMYYALRRLGREVEWVNYVNGGHGMPTTTVEEVRDYHDRILGWYGRHLRGDARQTEAQSMMPRGGPQGTRAPHPSERR